ncbi:hypothetical protein [Chitinophaga rhizosphaerae]|uniref:hypothetical protein n=1 Tax=Chitinophaga rhizosphaerae TaxID=1864947 RepID=UPI000F8084B4|nr:hypothetical protein [Chitinophaga rhizosphaerae]
MLLHILNGDATLEIFEKSGVPGRPLVWREMLSEGKTPAGCDLGLFFEKRGAYLHDVYGINREAYISDIGNTRKILQQASQFEEIVLWFEYDLFCQVNLIFLINYLLRLNTPMPRVSVVQPGSHPDVPDFRGLGMLKPEHFPPLFESRRYLEAGDWQLASLAWEAYTGNDPLAIAALTTQSAPNLPFLGGVLLAHLQRLPSEENGLNSIEKFFLEQITLAPLSERALFSIFWDEKKIFGFGDFQLRATLQRMADAGVVQHDSEMVRLTDLGREVLRGEQDYLAFAPVSNAWLGGIPLGGTPWRWSNREGKVVKK